VPASVFVLTNIRGGLGGDHARQINKAAHLRIIEALGWEWADVGSERTSHSKWGLGERAGVAWSLAIARSISPTFGYSTEVALLSAASRELPERVNGLIPSYAENCDGAQHPARLKNLLLNSLLMSSRWV